MKHLAKHLLIPLLIASLPVAANAKGLLRDAEIENTLRTFADPIFSAADINPKSVRIFLVDDPAINAYVAGGLNMFINTGLILNTDKPGMLIGVIAHETGHIAGAHLSKLEQEASSATLKTIISSVIGAATIAAGGKDVGAAILMGGQNTAMREMFSFYRGNEQAADQAALQFLDANQISATGMLDMFEVLRRKEKQTTHSSDPYLRTHPLTTERISDIRGHIEQSSIPKDAVPTNTAYMHARMVAKLYAFTEPPAKTFATYPESDTSEAARYARAIAWFRTPDLPKALQLMDELIKERPNDPYYLDTRGQILFENGKVKEAIKTYESASRLLPNNGLILADLGKSYLATNDPALLQRAIDVLERARVADDANTNTWRQLAIAYGKKGELSQSYAALAEESALAGNPEESLMYANRALKESKDGTPTQLHAQDLKNEAEQLIKEKKDKKSLF